MPTQASFQTVKMVLGTLLNIQVTPAAPVITPVLSFPGIVSVGSGGSGGSFTISALTDGLALVTFSDGTTGGLQGSIEVQVVDALLPGEVQPTSLILHMQPTLNAPDLDLVNPIPNWSDTNQKWYYVTQVILPKGANSSVTSAKGTTLYATLYDTNTGAQLTAATPYSSTDISNGYLYVDLGLAPGHAPVVVVARLQAIQAGAVIKESPNSDTLLLPVNGLVVPPPPVTIKLKASTNLKPFNLNPFAMTGGKPYTTYQLVAPSANGALVAEAVTTDALGNATFQVLFPLNTSNPATPVAMDIAVADLTGRILLAPVTYTTNVSWGGVTATLGRVGTAQVAWQANCDTNVSTGTLDIVSANGATDYLPVPHPIVSDDPTVTSTVNVSQPIPGGTNLLCRLTINQASTVNVLAFGTLTVEVPATLVKVVVSSLPVTTGCQPFSLVGPQYAPAGQPGLRAQAGVEYAFYGTSLCCVTDGLYYDSNPASAGVALNGNTLPIWFEVELAAPKVFVGCRFNAWQNSGYPAHFQILGSNDGVTYTKVYETPCDHYNWGYDYPEENVANRGDRDFLFETNTTAYLIYRWEITKVVTGGLLFNEVELFEAGFEPSHDYVHQAFLLQPGVYGSRHPLETYTTNQGVSLNFAESTPGTIYYTLDGSDPATSATAKTFIDLNKTVLHACTMRILLKPVVAGIPSVERQCVINMDYSTNPCLVLVNNAGGTYTGSVTVQPYLNWSQNGQFNNGYQYYTTDGSDPMTSTTRQLANYGYTLTAGTHTIRLVGLFTDENGGWTQWTPERSDTYIVN